MTFIKDTIRNRDEIRNRILSELRDNSTVRIASINKDCFDENTMWQVINDMKSQNLIDYDQSFIWVKK